MLKIIGFSGKKFTGKSASAGFLGAALGVSFARFSFATWLKSGVMEDFGLTYAQITQHKEDPIIVGGIKTTPRELLIKVAAFYRGIDQDFYLRPLVEYLKNPPLNIKYLIIDDVRYLNEAELILKNDGLLFRVERPGLVNLNHPSETQLDNFKNFKNIIQNDSDLNNLKKKIKNLEL